ncbi:acyl-CoA ligase FadD12 [Mycolicibacter minnesotensis]
MAPGLLEPITRVGSMLATFTRTGLLAPLRPDKYLRIAAAAIRDGGTTTTGIAMAAQRCGDRPAIIDEHGTLTYAELDRRCDALAAGLQRLPGRSPQAIALMCRNHHGFIEALAAANRIGADVLLLNTSFAGPALAEVVAREGVDLIFYDEEFTAAVDLAVPADSGCTRVVSWADTDIPGLTIADLIAANTGRRPAKTSRAGKLVMLTSGTTGTPKGARRSGRGGGGIADLQAIFDRIPWHTEENVVIAAPMFHAWGFSQLALALTMSCTVVTRRKFDPEATLALIEENHAAGLCVVPVMFDRIMALPDEVRAQYPCSSLRFATASGSRMRPDVVTAFMDSFGDVVYNNYNATEAGMIALATPEDLRYAPDTAGRPAPGSQIRILDAEFAEVPTGVTGQIFVRNSSQFDGYTGGDSKLFHDGFMASGDLGYFDSTGRLFVVGRDDEMIVSGGENVYPIETEKTLTSHAAVAEAAVIGVDDADYGQRLVAFVVLEPGAQASPEELKQHVRDNLAGYKVPRAITILEALPRNNTGKVLRRELQALV